MAMPFVAIIPARRGSTRLPDKPLLDLGGRPMVVRTAERALASAATRVVVATDDEAIASACRLHAVETVMTGSHHASGTDRLAEAAALLNLADDCIVVNVQGDEPFIAPRLIGAVADALSEARDCAMATACHAIEDAADMFNPNVVKVVRSSAGLALYFSRAPIPYARDQFQADPGARPPIQALRHIGIYAYRVSFLKRFPKLSTAPLEQIEMLEQLRVLWHGERIACIETDQMPHPGIDTEDDLARARDFFSAIHN